MLLLLLLLLISLSLILLLLLLLLFIIYLLLLSLSLLYYYYYYFHLDIILTDFVMTFFFSFCSSIARPVTSRCHCYQDHARYTDTRHKIHGNEFPRRIIIGFNTTRKRSFVSIKSIYIAFPSPPPPFLIFNDRFQFCFIFRSKKKIECDYLFIFFLPILPGGYVIFFAWIA